MVSGDFCIAIPKRKMCMVSPNITWIRWLQTNWRRKKYISVIPYKFNDPNDPMREISKETQTLCDEKRNRGTERHVSSFQKAVSKWKWRAGEASTTRSNDYFFIKFSRGKMQRCDWRKAGILGCWLPTWLFAKSRSATWIDVGAWRFSDE